MGRPARASTQLRAWRSNVLMRAGCEPALAWELAADARVDLHDLLNLIDRGCPPDLAVRILAPIERPERTDT